MDIIFIEPEKETYDTSWFIDHGPFYDRFGAAQMAVLMSADATVIAIIKNLSSRKWVDLKLPVVAQSLAIIGSIIPTVTAELQTYILTTPVTPIENFALRKLYFY